MKNYLIIGASLKSKGAEAMIMETYRQIKAIDSDNTVVISTASPDYEIHYISNGHLKLDVSIVDSSNPRYSKNRVINAAFSFWFKIRDIFAVFINRVISKNTDIKLHYRVPSVKSISESDVVLQIAGISFTENFGMKSAWYWAYQMVIAHMMKKKFFCMPQSFGPSDNIGINTLARFGLNRVDHIMPRGKKSLEYLNKLHLKNRNITFVPDLAFSFKNPDAEEDEIVYEKFGIEPSHKHIAIIFNTNIYIWNGDAIIRLMSTVIDRLISTYGYHVLLIPHEIDDKGEVDDIFVNRLIYEGCIRKENIINITTDLRANEVKSLLKICEFSVCSRFHGMISSLKVGVPPVVIGWADKYYEIMELFHLEDMVLDYRIIDEDAICAKISDIISKSEDYHDIIESYISDYETSSELMREIIQKNITTP